MNDLEEKLDLTVSVANAADVSYHHAGPADFDNSAEPSFTEEIHYRNYTTTPLCMARSDGTYIILLPERPSVAEDWDNLVIVKKQMSSYNKAAMVAKELEGGASLRGHKGVTMMDIRRASVDEHWTTGRVNMSSFKITIPHRALTVNKGVYVKPIDATVSVMNSTSHEAVNVAPKHPFGLESSIETFMDSVTRSTYRDIYGIKMFVVDSSNRHKSLYVNSFGKVHEVPIKRCTLGESVLYEDGLWIYAGSDHLNIHDPDDVPEFKHYTPDVMFEQFPIYRSREEAEIEGCGKKRAEVALKEQERAIHRENLELKRKMEVLKIESARSKNEYDTQSMAMKQDYEYRSYQRRDISESLKFASVAIPALLGFGVAVLSFMRK